MELVTAGLTRVEITRLPASLLPCVELRVNGVSMRALLDTGMLYMNKCIYIHIYMWIDTYIFTSIYIHIYTYMFTYTYIFVGVCICICMYVYISTFLYIHIYTYTYFNMYILHTCKYVKRYIHICT